MRFLLDEGADARLLPHLMGLGHDVTSVAFDYRPSLADAEVLDIAHREGRVLITNDQDFGDLIFGRGQAHSGVILFRLRTTRLDTKLMRLDHVLAEYADHLLEFIVVTPSRVRVRR